MIVCMGVYNGIVSERLEEARLWLSRVVHADQHMIIQLNYL